jgi:hypothetical protein
LVGIMSSVVMAAPPDKPLDSWAYISDKVDAIWSAVTDVHSSVNATDAKVDDVQSLVGDIYDATANTTKIISGSGNYTVPGVGVYNALDIDQNSVAQVTLTVTQSGFGDGDNTFVRLYYPEINPALTIIDGWGPVTTVVFAAEDWDLNVEGDGGEKIAYAYTIIYH